MAVCIWVDLKHVGLHIDFSKNKNSNISYQDSQGEGERFSCTLTSFQARHRETPFAERASCSLCLTHKDIPLTAIQ
jgi:hypothetical protein